MNAKSDQTMNELSAILQQTGTTEISGEYFRKSPGGKQFRYFWYIYVNDIGDCEMFTNDVETDYYTLENAYYSDSIMECLQKVRKIIEEASA